MTKEEMHELILQSCRENGLRNAYVRPIVARGVATLDELFVQLARPAAVHG